MRAPKTILLAAAPAVLVAAACGPSQPAQLVRGEVLVENAPASGGPDGEWIPADIGGIRLLEERRVVASSTLAADGSFLLVLPEGSEGLLELHAEDGESLAVVGSDITLEPLRVHVCEVVPVVVDLGPVWLVPGACPPSPVCVEARTAVHQCQQAAEMDCSALLDDVAACLNLRETECAQFQRAHEECLQAQEPVCEESEQQLRLCHEQLACDEAEMAYTERCSEPCFLELEHEQQVCVPDGPCEAPERFALASLEALTLGCEAER